MHSPTQFQWDDLQHFLAVAHHGSTLAAGRALGVDQSTVQRRLAELERQIGQSLVQRQPTGYRLTEFGQEMLPFAESVESAALAFERQIQTLAGETTGVIRMTCPEPIVNRITQTGLLDRFHARHPALRVQFVMSDKYMDLRQGDADVALRSGDTDDGELVGRKIGDSVWAVYASKAYIAQHGQPERIEDLASHALVGFDDTMARHRLSSMAARGGAERGAGIAQQQRARLDLFGEGGARCWRAAHATGRCGARSRAGVRAGDRTDPDLAHAHHA